MKFFLAVVLIAGSALSAEACPVILQQQSCGVAAVQAVPSCAAELQAAPTCGVQTFHAPPVAFAQPACHFQAAFVPAVSTVTVLNTPVVVQQEVRVKGKFRAVVSAPVRVVAAPFRALGGGRQVIKTKTVIKN